MTGLAANPLTNPLPDGRLMRHVIMDRIAARNVEWRYYLAWRLEEITRSYLAELGFAELHAQQVTRHRCKHGYVSMNVLQYHFQNMERWWFCISSAQQACSM